MGGKIGLSFGKGLAKVMGKRLAQKLGIPLQPGEHELRIEIDDQEHSLYWCRCFDQQDMVRSIFRAFGNYADVYLLEKTALIQLILTVDIIDFAWRQRSLVRAFSACQCPAVISAFKGAQKNCRSALPVPCQFFHAVDYAAVLLSRTIGF